MTEWRAKHSEVFEYLAGPTGLTPRSVERVGERIRARFPAGWPHITPGRARGAGEKRQIDPVHLTFLVIGTAGAPNIADAADACRLFVPMLSEAAFPVDLGNGVARFPATPDPLEWTLGRFIHHAILNQIDAADFTFCLSAPIAQIHVRGTDLDLVFRPAPRPDGKIWFPRYMSPVLFDRDLAMRTLRTVSGALLAGLGALLTEAEEAPPVPRSAADRLDDLRSAA